MKIYPMDIDPEYRKHTVRYPKKYCPFCHAEWGYIRPWWTGDKIAQMMWETRQLVGWACEICHAQWWDDMYIPPVEEDNS